MAKKILSETIDFCLRRCTVTKIHRLVFEGESGDLCRLRSLAKRDELWGVLSSPYLLVSLGFVFPSPFISRSFSPLIIVVLPLPLLPKPLRLHSPTGSSPSGFSSLSSRRHPAFQFSLPLCPFPFALIPFPFSLL